MYCNVILLSTSLPPSYDRYNLLCEYKVKMFVYLIRCFIRLWYLLVIFELCERTAIMYVTHIEIAHFFVGFIYYFFSLFFFGVRFCMSICLMYFCAL